MRGGPEASQAAQPVARPRLGARRAFWAAATITAAAAALALICDREETGRPGRRTRSRNRRRCQAGGARRSCDAHPLPRRIDRRFARQQQPPRDALCNRRRHRPRPVARRRALRGRSPPGRRFRIWVGSAYVEVIGTIFTVDRLPTGVRVSVERGVVEGGLGAERDAAVRRNRRGRPNRSDAGAARDGHSRRAHRSVLPSAWSRSRPREPPAPPSPTTSRGALLRASEAARRNGHPQDAVTSLQRLLGEHPRNPRAPYAAFILGRVLLEELHRPREAAAAFAQVEALDANTPLVQDALAREVESWARAGELDRARQAAGTYLGRYPNGRRANEVRRYSRME